MPTLQANDGVKLHYEMYGPSEATPLILLHGFTGSGAVFKRNIAALSQNHRVIVPDLRGHGSSAKPKAGYHVARLALDLQNLIDECALQKGTIRAIGTSLGAAILWCYSELFSTSAFSHMIFVDQAPLQNYLDDWGPELGNRGCNSFGALQAMQKSLIETPRLAHLGTISACLGYRSHPQAGDPSPDSPEWKEDEAFFMEQAMKGEGWWYGKLMADHTANDWRYPIQQNFGPENGSTTKVLVVASSRSGCFPAAGPLRVVSLINGNEEQGLAKGVTISWGGHWCYWEKPELFNHLVLGFLA
ncbi:alpha/beta-hydrolase [Decorospora gaudefroyi]|uniref:Alpha/beta-hydrolase n=1 Tax=Decorospora gaudefroyi TaxID=184978 RepID=A0A6A5K7M6_9PLEO|nr:alpha/beta-hydrolase [Decorospora gaudefroyi]